MIEINNLTVRYRRKNEDILALDRFSIDLDEGEIYTFIGPSGCGKSTLLHVLSGILKDYSGNVTIDGSCIDPQKQRIGLVLQDYGLLPWKTVYRNAVLGLNVKKDKLYKDEYVEYIFRQLGLGSLLNRYPRELSGGQKQRVAIARAFILRPDLLLMDEPFSALDAIAREEIQELFLKIWERNNVTTAFITHSVDEALYLGSRIVVFMPGPGRVLRVMENPCFRLNNLRCRSEYHEMTKELRKIIDEGWSKS